MNRTLLPFLALALWFILPVPPSEGQSILVALMQRTEAVVHIKAEAGVVFGNKSKPYIDKATGRMFIQKSLRPIVHTRTGTGVIIEPSGLVVANAHTVRKAGRVTVKLQSGKTYEAEVLSVSDADDLALLRIDPERKLAFFPLSDSDQLKLNETVYSIGGSTYIKNSISQGKVSGIGVNRKAGNAREFLRVTFNIYQGDSGSPVLNDKGQLLGIMSGAAVKQNKKAYAIPSRKIIQFCKEYISTTKKLVEMQGS